MVFRTSIELFPIIFKRTTEFFDKKIYVSCHFIGKACMRKIMLNFIEVKVILLLEN